MLAYDPRKYYFALVNKHERWKVISDKDDIDLFINMFAVNAEQFDWKQYVVDVDETKTSPIIMPGQ